MAEKNQVRCPVGRRAWCPVSRSRASCRTPGSRFRRARPRRRDAARTRRNTGVCRVAIIRDNRSRMTADRRRAPCTSLPRRREAPAINSGIRGNGLRRGNSISFIRERVPIRQFIYLFNEEIFYTAIHFHRPEINVKCYSVECDFKRFLQDFNYS